jgi:hypothetical protein
VNSDRELKGIMELAIPENLRRRRVSSVGVVIFICGALILSSLVQRMMPYSRTAIVGTYYLNDDSRGVEVLTLRSDSTFTQRFRGATHAGRWEYVRLFGQRSYVLLHQLRIFVDARDAPQGLIDAGLPVRPGNDGPMLVLKPDLGVMYKKDIPR